MSKLAERLKDPKRSGVYRVTSDAALVDSRKEAQISLHRIRLDGVRTKGALLERIGETLQFPDAWGRNWDALKDCLSDLSWLDGRAHLLAFEAFEELPAEDLQVLVEILEEDAALWRKHAERFFAVFLDSGRRLSLPDLHREK